jgi:hypothetical protein
MLATQQWENLHAQRPTTLALTARYYFGAVTRNDAPDQRHNVMLAYAMSDGAVHTISGGYVINEQPQACGGRVVFNSLQQGNKLIGGYSLTGSSSAIQSARAFLRLPVPSALGGVWIDHLRVTEFPILLGDATTLFFSEGGVYVAVTPLIGASETDAPTVLREEHQGLTLSVYDCVPPPSGESWGPQLAGYAMEVASSEEFDTLDGFRHHIAQAEWEDILENNVRTITYASGDDRLCLSVQTGQEQNAQRKILRADEPLPAPSV